MDFYTTVADPCRNPRATIEFRKTWSKAGANRNGWIDGNFGAYQCVNLVTQRDGGIFLIAFNRSGGDDWMDLFSVDVDAPPATMLKKLAKKHMFCSDGCSFEHGACFHPRINALRGIRCQGFQRRSQDRNYYPRQSLSPGVELGKGLRRWPSHVLTTAPRTRDDRPDICTCCALDEKSSGGCKKKKKKKVRPVCGLRKQIQFVTAFALFHSAATRWYSFSASVLSHWGPKWLLPAIFRQAGQYS